MKRTAIILLQMYRKYLSGIKIQCCRFYPSCSEYAIGAIEKYGLLRGFFITCGRVVRCHPFSKGGYDPVR